MSKIIISKSAVLKAIEISNQTKDDLLTNIQIMDENVNSEFEGLQDPTISNYLALSDKLKEKLVLITTKLDSISSYCEEVARWVDKYTDI